LDWWIGVGWPANCNLDTSAKAMLVSFIISIIREEEQKREIKAWK
jgi:hypothetical protein